MSCADTRASAREILLSLGSRSLARDAVRAVLLERRAEIARELPASVRREERRALSLLRRPRYPDVRPRLHRIGSADGALWHFLRVVLSSCPYNGRPGRLMRYLVVDDASGGVLGVVDLGSEAMQLKPRDDLIGWDAKQKLRGGGLRRVVNLGTCVCAQPFGWLCGGKFIAEAVASKDVADDWRTRYGDALALACTTSLYGKSSQYNRLPHWVYLGDTPGASPHMLLTLAQKRVLKSLLKRERVGGRKGGYGGDLGSMMDVVSKAAGLCGIAQKDLGRGQPRGVYASELYAGAVADLRRGTSTGSPERTASDASKWWADRWRDMRWPKVREQIESFDWSSYSLASVSRAGSAASGTLPTHGRGDGATPLPALRMGGCEVIAEITPGEAAP